MYIVDRKEENIVICQDGDGNNIDIELSEFAYMPSDGDIVYKTEKGYEKDEEKTKQRAEKIKNRFSSLFGGR